MAKPINKKRRRSEKEPDAMPSPQDHLGSQKIPRRQSRRIEVEKLPTSSVKSCQSPSQTLPTSDVRPSAECQPRPIPGRPKYQPTKCRLPVEPTPRHQLQTQAPSPTKGRVQAQPSSPTKCRLKTEPTPRSQLQAQPTSRRQPHAQPTARQQLQVQAISRRRVPANPSPAQPTLSHQPLAHQPVIQSTSTDSIAPTPIYPDLRVPTVLTFHQLPSPSPAFPPPSLPLERRQHVITNPESSRNRFQDPPHLLSLIHQDRSLANRTQQPQSHSRQSRAWMNKAKATKTSPTGGGFSKQPRITGQISLDGGCTPDLF